MVAALMKLDREAVTSKLIDRYPKEWEGWGGVNIAQIMGGLSLPEFVPILLKSLGQDNDFVCEAAMKALGKIGEAAEKEICENWHALSESQQIYSFGALEYCGGERTIKLLQDIFPEVKGEDLELWCTAAWSVPDSRLIKVLEPELKRKQYIIDETFLTLCALLDYNHPDLQAVHARWLKAEEMQRAKRGAFDNLEFQSGGDGKINIELACPLCGESNTYDVGAVFVSPESERERGGPFIGEELYCLSCGELADLEPTAKGLLAITAELLKARFSRDQGHEYNGPLQFANARLASGRVVSIWEAISHYRQRLEKEPHSIVDMISLGNCYRAANHPIRAKELFQKSIETNPAYVEASLWLAYLLDADGCNMEAFEVLDRSLAYQKQWRFCRLKGKTEQDFHYGFADLYNRLRNQLNLKNKPVLHPGFAKTRAPETQKIGRNSPCPCGSGKKYKKCCLGKDQAPLTLPTDEPVAPLAFDGVKEIIPGHAKFDMEGFESRIKSILGEADDLEVSEKSLLKYRKYLEAHLSKPCLLTGIEDFQWEEFYVLGPGNQKEYQELKKTRPSYQDTFELLEFTDEFGGLDDGMMVKVRRLSDRKQFVLPLAELKGVDQKSGSYPILEDYSVWIINYR
jgi:tetratricopeptide (TPR) repeat protein